MIFRFPGSRVSLLALAIVAPLTLVGCNDEGTLPLNGRHYVPISTEMQGLLRERNMRTHAPILVRTFKKESELEVWKKNQAGQYELLKTYPMCRWSGQLGPKVREGDRQVPEGFYAVNHSSMNPNSSFYLSFNIGYPNAYDRAHGRTGSHIMVHGDCSSMGCFAMTDNQIADIYALAREAMAGGQRSIQVQSFPFRFTPENMATFRQDPNMPFWRNLKEGNDFFETTRRDVQVSVCNRRYVFHGAGTDGCDTQQREPELVASMQRKQRADEQKTAELARSTPALKRVYRDGDMHPVFRETLVAQAGRSVGTTRNGISRQETLVDGPVDIPVEQYRSGRTRGKTATQIAEAAIADRFRSDTVAAGGVTAAPTAAPTAPVPAAAPADQPTAVAAAPRNATPRPAAAQAPAAQPAAVATALAPAEKPAAESQPLLQRMLGGIGLGAGNNEQANAPLVEQSAPQRVTVPLPPGRQATSPAERQAPQAGVSRAGQIPASLLSGTAVAPAGNGFTRP
jgi:murein L,D-transpeptidase YafK